MKTQSLTKRRKLVRSIAAMFVGGAILSTAVAPTAHATTFTWTSTTTGARSWTDTTNWAGGSQYFSDASNELMFFSDSTTNIAAITQTFTNVPTTLSMNTLTLNGKGAGSGASSSSITIGSSASTWTIGDGATSIVNLNANFGATGAADFNINVAANLTLNQANTLFTGNGTAGQGTTGTGNGFVFSGNIGQAASGYGITKDGTSTLTLTGNNNTFTGNININSTGALRIGGAGVLGAGNYAGDITFGAAGKFQYSSSANQIFSGAITGATGILTKDTGAGKLTLSGTTSNTYGGLTTVSAGTLELNKTSNGTRAIATGGVTVIGSTLQYAATAGDDQIADAAAVTLANGAGVATLNLNGISDTIGSLTIGGANGTGTSQGIVTTGAGTLTLGGNVQYTSTGAPLAASISGNLNLGAATRTFSVQNSSPLIELDVSAAISGTGVGITKTSIGALQLSGANTYTGVTTVSAGTLQINKKVSLYNNNTANWTAANINVASGAILALNVDGSNGFDSTSLSTLLTNISVANSAAQGLQGGATLALDTTNAGGSFTQGNAITNSTGAFGGTISLTKLGAGTLVLDQANTYTGPTTISAGTLQLGSGSAAGSLSTSSRISVGSGAVLAVNQSDTVTQGTDFNGGSIDGLGGFTQTGSGTTILNQANTFSGTTTVSAGTLTLANVLALQNSALVTTTGTSTLGAFSAVTIGGLSGSRDLGSTDVLNGYTGNVTALTLNPQTGVSVTYSGIISNGSGSMSLTKTGAGTQILTGANSYTGATIVNAGTLTVGAGGSLNSSSALQVHGGTFTYGNTAAGQTLNGLAVGAGNSTVSNTATGQTLTLGGITRTASIFGTVNFATLTGPISTTTGNANGIIGPWATTGATTTLRYAVGSPDGSTPTNISALTGTTATVTTLANVTDPTANYEYSAAATTAANLTANTLRYSGGATATAIGATNTLTLNGLMQAGSNTLTISGGPSTGGLLIGSTGELVIAANAQATTISAVIGGTGRLVYSGAGSTLTLGVPNPGIVTNTYTGGTVINSGIVAISGTTNADLNATLGNTSSGIILNGGRLHIVGANISAARSVTVNGTGSSLRVHKNNNFTTSGALTGSGAITFVDNGGSGALGLYKFTSDSNSFTGAMSIEAVDVRVSSLGDTAGNNIVFTGAGTFKLNDTGATGGLTFNNRAFELSNTSVTIENLNTTHAFTIGSNLIATGTAAKTLTLTAAAGPTNVFSGNITDGSGGGTVAVTKAGAGTWMLSNANTFTGATNLSAGTLALTNSNALQNSALTMATGTLSLLNNTNNTTFATQGTTISGTSTINVGNNGSGTGNTLVLGGAINATNAGAMTINVTNANSYALSLGAITQSSTTGGALTIANTAPLNIASYTTNSNGTPSLLFTSTGTATITGNINQSGSGAFGLTRSTAAGTLILQGTSNMTGAVAITNGTIQTAVATNAFGSTSGISIGAAGILALRGDSSAAFSNGTTNYPVSLTASGATINVDQVSSATLGTTLTLGTVSMPGAYTLNTTGANGVSLGLGAVTGSTANNKVFNNTIGSTGRLNIASYAETDATARTVTFQGAGYSTVTGAISQNGANALSLTKTGTGTLALAGTNTYTGLTTVSDGVLRLDSANALPGGIATSGGTGALTLNGGILGLGNGDFTRALGTGVDQFQFAVISTTSGFAAFGADRTVNIGGAGATLSFNNGTNFPTSSFALSHPTADATLIFANGLNLSGGGRTIIVDNGSATVDARITGVINGGTGFTKSGTGTLQVTASNNMTGTLTISAGTLELGNNGNTGNFSSITTINNNANLSVNRSNAFTQATDLSNKVIAGTGSFTQTGSGTTTLTLANTYSGTTTVSAGKLSIGTTATPTGSINNSPVTINGATANFAYNSSTNYTAPLTFTQGTLSGTNWNGSLSGLTIDTGKTIAPGNSPGTATSVIQTWAGGGTYQWEINNTAGTKGSDPGWDWLNLSGALAQTATSANKFTIDITGLNASSNLPGGVSNWVPTQNYSFVIATAAGGITGFDANGFTINTANFTNFNTSTPGAWSIFQGNGTNGGTINDILLGYTGVVASGNNSQLLITSSPTTSFPATGVSTKTIGLSSIFVGGNSTTGTETITKSGSDGTTYSVTTSGAVASTTFVNGSTTASGTITLVNTSSGAKSGTVTIDNLASDSFGAGLGSADGDDVFTVTQNVFQTASITGAATGGNLNLTNAASTDGGQRAGITVSGFALSNAATDNRRASNFNAPALANGGVVGNATASDVTATVGTYSLKADRLNNATVSYRATATATGGVYTDTALAALATPTIPTIPIIANQTGAVSTVARDGVMGNYGSARLADIANGDTLAGYSSTVDAAAAGSPNPTDRKALGTTATILAGTATSDMTVSMAWRVRGANESSNILGTNDDGTLGVGYLISDVVNLSGMGAGVTDTFVLQMSYSEALLGVDVTSSAKHENDGANNGRIALVWNNAGVWENAVLGNFGGSSAYYKRAYNSDPLNPDNLNLGRWGVDTTTNTVWAVLNHNSEFAVIPEPSTLVLGGLALLGLAGAGLRKRRLAKR